MKLTVSSFSLSGGRASGQVSSVCPNHYLAAMVRGIVQAMSAVGIVGGCILPCCIAGLLIGACLSERTLSVSIIFQRAIQRQRRRAQFLRWQLPPGLPPAAYRQIDLSQLSSCQGVLSS